MLHDWRTEPDPHLRQKYMLDEMDYFERLKKDKEKELPLSSILFKQNTYDIKPVTFKICTCITLGRGTCPVHGK